jgi:hypothetical protein
VHALFAFASLYAHVATPAGAKIELIIANGTEAAVATAPQQLRHF